MQSAFSSVWDTYQINPDLDSLDIGI
jgi:hypothetical protein